MKITYPHSSHIMVLCIGFLFLLSCKEETVPKPKAMLRLEYVKAVYNKVQLTHCPFSFEMNVNAVIQEAKRSALPCAYNIYYPSLEATLFLTYKPVENNLRALLTDAQKITLEHTIKADEIQKQPFVQDRTRTYGMFSEVTGNSASQSQFYLTDSTSHFLTGSMYFNTKPNYDSIYPGAKYIANDIQQLMESVRWTD